MTDLTPNPTPAPESGELRDSIARIISLAKGEPERGQTSVGAWWWDARHDRAQPHHFEGECRDEDRKHADLMTPLLIASLTSELATVKKRLESAEGERGCTCHPDERPPVCQHKYALTDCLNLGAVKKAANLVFRIEAAGAWEYEDGNFERWKAEARRIAPDLRALQEQEKQNG